jgi:DNA repair photolyase
MGNMYPEAVFRWNICVGCIFNCKYCIPSFQRQMKRQKQNCLKCYKYEPHFHKERLSDDWITNSGMLRVLKNLEANQYIWVCSSGDISNMKPFWIRKIFKKMEDLYEKYGDLSQKPFFIQTKNPKFLYEYGNHYFLPSYLMKIGITLETNKDSLYKSFKISKAPLPSERKEYFLKGRGIEKLVTIEPILEFDMEVMVSWIKQIDPIAVYIGYDTKNCGLPEPPLSKTKELIQRLNEFTTVRPKLLRRSAIKSKRITEFLEVSR